MRPNRRGLLGLVGVTCLAGACALALPRTASAQPIPEANGQGFDTHLFRPAMDSKGFFHTNGTDTLGANDFSLGLVIDYGRNLLRVRDVGQSSPQLINHQFQGTFSFNYGIANMLVLGLSAAVNRGVEAPTLMRWAERAVPEALAARRPGERLAAPRALTEQLSAPQPPPPPAKVGLPPPPDRPRVSLTPWVFFGACASLFRVGGLSLLAVTRLRTEAAALPVEAVVEQAPAPEEAPSPPAPPPPTTRAPPAPKAAGVALTVGDGAEGVTLSHDGQTFSLPGVVPRGTYRASMRHWGAGTTSLLQITGPGAVHCDSRMRRCRLVPASSP